MSEKKQILIRDFPLFTDVMKSTVKLVDSAKFLIDSNGLTIYGAREKLARCEISTNSIYSNDSISFSILDMGMFVKILSTIKDVHEKDFSDLKFTLDSPFVRFESKKFKTKVTTCNDDVISQWVSKKVETQLTPVFQFKTTPELIKRVNSHAFMFSDTGSVRIYMETKPDMEKNALYATLGNKESNLNNEITLKLGLVTFGAIPADRSIILDLDRLNLFNALPSDSLEISLMNMNVLVGKSRLEGKNDSYFALTLYNTMLKS